MSGNRQRDRSVVCAARPIHHAESSRVNRGPRYQRRPGVTRSGQAMAPASDSAVISASVETPPSASCTLGIGPDTGPRGTALGVRLKRGAGAGWGAPSTSTNVRRSMLCGWARLRHRQHRREADFVAGEERDPLGARARADQRCDARFQLRPLRAVHLRGGVDVVETERTDQREQVGVELGFVRRDRHVLAVGRFRTRCRSARHRRAGSCRADPSRPSRRDRRRCSSTARCRRPSPRRPPDRGSTSRSTSAARMPMTTSEPPPPKSASRLIGGTGADLGAAVPLQHTPRSTGSSRRTDVRRGGTVLPQPVMRVDEA